MELLPLSLPLQCSLSPRLPLRPGPLALLTSQGFVRLHLGLRGRRGTGTRRAMEVALTELLGEELRVLVLLLLALTSLGDLVTTRVAARASTVGEGRHSTLMNLAPLLRTLHQALELLVMLLRLLSLSWTWR